jgi:hypothetical protein
MKMVTRALIIGLVLLASGATAKKTLAQATAPASQTAQGCCDPDPCPPLCPVK